MKEVVKRLKKEKMTIATMESCTGGAVSNEITNVPGASNILNFSAVTYSNEFKIKLGVSTDTIKKYSVYSMEVAKEMSKAISEYASSDIGIGITGKLNLVDKKNLYGKDNVVFISLYDKNNDKYIEKTVEVDNKDRIENKMIIVNYVKDIILNYLK